MSSQNNRRYSPNRVTPRRRKPRRTVFRHILLPGLKNALVVGVIVLVLGTAMHRVVRTGRLCGQEGREARATAQELQSLKTENDRLERQVIHAGTPNGTADGARELGMVKPGEITLVLPPESEGE